MTVRSRERARRRQLRIQRPRPEPPRPTPEINPELWPISPILYTPGRENPVSARRKSSGSGHNNPRPLLCHRSASVPDPTCAPEPRSRCDQYSGPPIAGQAGMTGAPAPASLQGDRPAAHQRFVPFGETDHAICAYTPSREELCDVCTWPTTVIVSMLRIR